MSRTLPPLLCAFMTCTRMSYVHCIVVAVHFTTLSLSQTFAARLLIDSYAFQFCSSSFALLHFTLLFRAALAFVSGSIADRCILIYLRALLRDTNFSHYLVQVSSLRGCDPWRWRHCVPSQCHHPLDLRHSASYPRTLASFCLSLHLVALGNRHWIIWQHII